ncbi:hypothetical protein E2C01_078032 [Portunus trituberculatus]|uniref:Uncharacterized protein n=1 Tax=Portunus trituberculatus TaxID=210409 RepID=A0A5B7IT18_PORTR|nr:hypothetical protein [Portunus trituberculatus]
MKLGVLRRLRQFISPLQLLTLYKDLIQGPYQSLYEVLPLTVLSDGVESKALRLINSPPLTIFSFFITAEMLHLFLSFIAIFMVTALLILHASSALLLWHRCTRLSSSSHTYSVQLSNTRVNQYSQSFIPFSGKLWNSLPASVFPSSCDLTSFKREVTRHLSLAFGKFFFQSFKELTI